MFSAGYISLLRPAGRRSIFACLIIAFMTPSLHGQGPSSPSNLKHLYAGHSQPIVLPNLPFAKQNLSLEPSALLEEASPVREWRRTKQGWELKTRWNALNPQWGPAPPAAKIHPVVICLMQALLSIAALLFFEDRRASNDLITLLKTDQVDDR